MAKPFKMQLAIAACLCGIAFPASYALAITMTQVSQFSGNATANQGINANLTTTNPGSFNTSGATAFNCAHAAGEKASIYCLNNKHINPAIPPLNVEIRPDEAKMHNSLDPALPETARVNTKATDICNQTNNSSPEQYANHCSKRTKIKAGGDRPINVGETFQLGNTRVGKKEGRTVVTPVASNTGSYGDFCTRWPQACGAQNINPTGGIKNTGVLLENLNDSQSSINQGEASAY